MHGCGKPRCREDRTDCVSDDLHRVGHNERIWRNPRCRRPARQDTGCQMGEGQYPSQLPCPWIHSYAIDGRVALAQSEKSANDFWAGFLPADPATREKWCPPCCCLWHRDRAISPGSASRCRWRRACEQVDEPLDVRRVEEVPRAIEHDAAPREPRMVGDPHAGDLPRHAVNARRAEHFRRHQLSQGLNRIGQPRRVRRDGVDGVLGHLEHVGFRPIEPSRLDRTPQDVARVRGRRGPKRETGRWPEVTANLRDERLGLSTSVYVGRESTRSHGEFARRTPPVPAPPCQES